MYGKELLLVILVWRQLLDNILEPEFCLKVVVLLFGQAFLGHGYSGEVMEALILLPFVLALTLIRLNYLGPVSSISIRDHR
jgi:hypothetical protein